MPIQIWLGKNDKIQVYQYTGMSQYVNLNPYACSSLVIFMKWPCERQGNIFIVLRSESLSGKCAEFHTVPEG